jgi:hypothetical protein
LIYSDDSDIAQAFSRARVSEKGARSIDFHALSQSVVTDKASIQILRNILMLCDASERQISGDPEKYYKHGIQKRPRRARKMLA